MAPFDQPKTTPEQIEHQHGAKASLHAEAIDSLTKRARPRMWDIDDGGKISVQSGDTLWSIAKRSLSSRGLDSKDAVAVFDEVDRIEALNLQINPKFNKNRLHVGEQVQIKELSVAGKDAVPARPALNEPPRDAASKTDAIAAQADVRSRAVPSPSAASLPQADTAPCQSQELKAARQDAITFTAKCDRVVAGPGANVVVNAGAFAEVHPGGQAFVLPGGEVEAHGGFVIAGGGKIKRYPRAVVQMLRPTEVNDVGEPVVAELPAQPPTDPVPPLQVAQRDRPDQQQNVLRDGFGNIVHTSDGSVIHLGS